MLRALGVGLCAYGFAACDSIDTTRVAPKATLGDDIYGVMCDRLGASALSEDLTGASYHSICHFDANGVYGNAVDEARLPPPATDVAREARRLSLAKLHRLAARRTELVRALNAIFPDVSIDDPVTPEDGDTIRLHDALLDFAKSLSTLYEQNPNEPGGEPLMPSSTRAIGRLLAQLRGSDDALAALAKIWARRGYRPARVGMGIVQPALGYPKLRDLTRSAVSLLGPGGGASPALQDLLRVVEKEMKTAKPTLSPLPDYQVTDATAQPNRPRTALEVVAAVMLAEDPAYAKSDDEPARFISLRDRRGFVVPLGSQPGQPGTLQAPFSDLDGDGFADVDAFGRFVDATGEVLPIDPPFRVPGVSVGPVDDFDRPAEPLYRYLDTSRALTGAMSRSLVPLLDATKYATSSDEEPWLVEHESLMYALAGAYELYGDEEPAVYDYADESVKAPGQSCADCFEYTRFRGEDSPLVDLVHATGQVLADPESDALLLGLMDLVEHHPDTVARLMGALLHVREVALAHDGLADMGLEHRAELPYETPVWDEVAQVLSAMAERPGLTAKLVTAFGSDVMVTPTQGVGHLGEALSKFMGMRDRLHYDPQNLNGPPRNVTIGGASTQPPSTPIQPAAPRSGDNVSLLERSMRVIRDANGLKVCNKPGTQVHSKLFGLSLTYPLFGGTLDACELFRFENMGAFYLGTLLPPSHPKRATMKIDDGFLSTVLDFYGNFGDPGEIFESSSGIVGFTFQPTAPALSRFVFFGASQSSLYPGMPDVDTQNQGSDTDEFIGGVIEPASSVVCPVNGDDVHQCASSQDVLRVRDANSMFAWEHFGFHDYLRPALTVFANESCTDDLLSCDVDDYTGEVYFMDLIGILYRHYPGPDHGPECSKTGSAQTNPKYCSEAGINRYEPILTEALQGDLVPAIVELSRVASDLSQITVQRGPSAGQVWTGADVMEKLVRVLFSQPYAAQRGVVDRAGSASGAWVDGTPQAQTTPFALFADALHRIDVRLDASGEPERKAMWKRARSHLVDELLAVEGTGSAARWKNPTTPRMLLSVLRVMREQLNANCPSRESGIECTWAKRGLGDKLATTMSGPLFAAIVRLGESVRTDDEARRELGRFLTHVLEAATTGGAAGDTLHATLATLSDILQVLQDDGVLSPIINAISSAAAPSASDAGRGAADTAIAVLKALSSDEYDRYHVLDTILPAVVTPRDELEGRAPIEVILDVVADVHRIDASSDGPLDAADYESILRAAHEFLTSDTRGFEQLYAIVEKRPR